MKENGYRKTYNDKYICCFFTICNLETQECINVDRQCYREHKFTLSSANSHCNFHNLFMKSYASQTVTSQTLKFISAFISKPFF